MPQNNMNNGGRRKGSRPYSFEANTLVNSGVRGTDLVSGAVLHNGCTTAATKTSVRTSNDTENRNTPPCIVNGHINNKCNGFVRKTAPPWTNKRRGSRISAVTDASASGRIINAGTSHGVPVNGEVVALPHDSEKSHRADAKNPRPWKKFKRKKRWETYLKAAINKSKCTLIHNYSQLSAESHLHDLGVSCDEAGLDIHVSFNASVSDT